MGSKLGSFLRVLGAGLSPQAFAAQTNEFAAEQAAGRAKDLRIETAATARDTKIEDVNVKSILASSALLGKQYSDPSTTDEQKKQIVLEQKALGEKIGGVDPRYKIALQNSWLQGVMEDSKDKTGSFSSKVIIDKNTKKVIGQGIFNSKKGRTTFENGDELGQDMIAITPSAGLGKDGLGKPIKSEQAKFDEFSDNFAEMKALEYEIISAIDKSPNIIGFMGVANRAIDTFKDQMLGVAQDVFDVKIEASMDIEDYDFGSGAAAKSAELQTNLFNLAIASAASKGNSGKALSDSDLQREITSIGGGMTSRAQLKAKIAATIRGAERRHRSKYKRMYGRLPPKAKAKQSPMPTQENEQELDRQLKETQEMIRILKEKVK